MHLQSEGCSSAEFCFFSRGSWNNNIVSWNIMIIYGGVRANRTRPCDYRNRENNSNVIMGVRANQQSVTVYIIVEINPCTSTRRTVVQSIRRSHIALKNMDYWVHFQFKKGTIIEIRNPKNGPSFDETFVEDEAAFYDVIFAQPDRCG